MHDFQWTPASTVSTPDTFTSDRVDEIYQVVQDTDAEDPREWVSDTHAALYVYSGPRGYREEVPGNPIAEAFAHFYRTYDAEKSLAMTRRWLNLFHPELVGFLDFGTATVRGYSQSDWAEVFVVASDGYGTAAEHVDEYRMWAFGDVWAVSAIGGESTSGIYAESPAEALEQYLEQHPPAYDRLIFDNPVAKALADALVDRGDVAAAVWLHGNEEVLFGQDPALSVGMLLDRLQRAAALRADSPAD